MLLHGMCILRVHWCASSSVYCAGLKLQDSKDMVSWNASTCMHSLSCQVSMLLTELISPVATEPALSMYGLAHILDAVCGTCCIQKQSGSFCKSSKQFPVFNANAMRWSSPRLDWPIVACFACVINSSDSRYSIIKTHRSVLQPAQSVQRRNV